MNEISELGKVNLRYLEYRTRSALQNALQNALFDENNKLWSSEQEARTLIDKYAASLKEMGLIVDYEIVSYDTANNVIELNIIPKLSKR